MQASGRVWVVTGAGSGIGRELVLLLLRRGARVAAVDRSPGGLVELVEEAAAGPRLSTHVLDVADAAGVEELPAEVVAAHGVVDGLVNNAGIIQPFVPVADLDDDTIQRVWDVNLAGPLHLVRVFLPLLLVRPEAHVANVSSMGGFFPFPGQTIYGASKAALKLLSEGLYAELLDTPVRVSVVMPGAVDTGIAQHSGVTVPTAGGESRMRALPAARAAEIIVRGLERNRLHILVGPDARLMNLAIKLAPGPAIRLVRKQMAALLEPDATHRTGRGGRSRKVAP